MDTQTIFKSKQKLSADEFIKNFFVTQTTVSSKNEGNASDSSSDETNSVNYTNGSSASISDLFGRSSTTGSTGGPSSRQ